LEEAKLRAPKEKVAARFEADEDVAGLSGTAGTLGIVETELVLCVGR
jgi:hypothetical protein